MPTGWNEPQTSPMHSYLLQDATDAHLSSVRDAESWRCQGCYCLKGINLLRLFNFPLFTHMRDGSKGDSLTWRVITPPSFICLPTLARKWGCTLGFRSWSELAVNTACTVIVPDRFLTFEHLSLINIQKVCVFDIVFVYTSLLLDGVLYTNSISYPQCVEWRLESEFVLQHRIRVYWDSFFLKSGNLTLICG